MDTYLALCDYDIHLGSYGLVINQKSEVHGTILRQTTGGSFWECKDQHLPALLDALRKELILDDLSEVSDG